MTEYNIRLNPNCASVVHTGLRFKAGDKGITFKIAVDELDTIGTTAKIVFLRANGTSVESDIFGTDGVYTYKTLGNEFAVPGKTVADVKFYASKERVSTASFVFEVSGDTMDGLGAGTGGYSDRLEQLVSEAEAAGELTEQVKAELETAENDMKVTEAEMAAVLQNFKEQYGEVGALNPRGNWNSNTNYSIRDLVYYNSISWICLAPNTDVAPADTNTAFWMRSTDLEAILNGTTPVGNALKLNGLTAEEVGASGARNLIPYPYRHTTMTTNGITFTDNGDGTITANGTATATAIFTCRSRTDTPSWKIPNGVYTLSGCADGGDATKYRIQFGREVNGSFVEYTSDFGNGSTIEITDNAQKMQLQIAIATGVTVSNLTFKPMLELGKIAHDFMPYHFGGAKDADTVDGWNFYSSLSELGLTEATATAESIVNAMPNKSILVHALSGTATSAALAFPYNYSLFRVTKLSTSYAQFECIGTGSGLIYYGYYNSGTSTKWSGWSTKFLPLTGGKLTGNLEIASASSDASTKIIQYNGGSYFRNYVSDTEYTDINLTKTNVLFKKRTSTGIEEYDMLHTGNKPSGSYNGNGSAESRTINTGGVGNIVAVWSPSTFVLVYGSGGFGFNNAGNSTSFTSAQLKHTMGNLTIASDSALLNSNNVTYYYQVL